VQELRRARRAAGGGDGPLRLAELEAVQAATAGLQQAALAARGSIATDDPGRHAYTGQLLPHAGSLAELQQLLPARSCALMVADGDGGALAVIVTAGGLQLLPLPPLDDAGGAAAAQALGAAIAPLLPADAETLWIAATGAAAALPLETAAMADGQPWAARYELLRVPTLTLLADLLRQPARAVEVGPIAEFSAGPRAGLLGACTANGALLVRAVVDDLGSGAAGLGVALQPQDGDDPLADRCSLLDLRNAAPLPAALLFAGPAASLPLRRRDLFCSALLASGARTVVLQDVAGTALQLDAAQLADLGRHRQQPGRSPLLPWRVYGVGRHGNPLETSK
jgi:hypothetical protein